MLISLSATINHGPALSVHGESVRLDFGELLIEMDIQSFRKLIVTLVIQGVNQGLNLSTK